MNSDIPAAVKEQATKCWREHACVNGNGDKPLCGGERCVSNRFLFVSSKPPVNCPYGIAFGFASHVCSCPVRNALYRQQGV